MQVNFSPPVLYVSIVSLQVSKKLTVVDASGHTTTRLSVNIAYILLQARVGDAARAVGNRAVGVLAGLHDHCRGQSEESKDGGSERELHVCGWLVEDRKDGGGFVE